MCGKAPKPPKVLPDPELARQNKEARVAASVDRAEAKRRRTEEALGKLAGFGRLSLLTGGRGGAGYAAPRGRSLFVTNGSV